MSHKHRFDQLTLIQLIPQQQDKDGLRTLFNSPKGLIGYACSVEEKAVVGDGRVPCEAVDPRYFLPLAEAEQKYKEMQDA